MKKIAAEKNPFKTALRKSGYKATPARLAILALFKKSKNPLSAQEIIDALPPSSSGADQATIYRTLKSLKTSGIIRQIDLRHNHAHYELADIADHHHLICLRCGRIEDVAHSEAEAVQADIIRHSKHFAEIQQHTLEFYGMCKACARKSEVAEIAAHKDAPL